MMLNSVITAFGVLTLGNLLYRLWSFLYVHYLHRTTIQRFQRDYSYALITGSGGGLGLALAEDLYDRGFNIILHGRNLEKLQKLRGILNERPSPRRDVQCFIADARADPSTWNFEPLKGFTITALFLAAGGDSVRPLRVDELTDEQVHGTIRFNALFPLNLTKFLLPQMRAKILPLLIVAIGSEAAGLVQPPYVSIYAGSKGFLHKWIKGLAADEGFVGNSDRVTVHHMRSGEFMSDNGKLATESFMCPTAKTMAKAVIGCVGCGEVSLLPYVGHAVAIALMGLLGERISEKVVAHKMRQSYLGEPKKE